MPRYTPSRPWQVHESVELNINHARNLPMVRSKLL
jgi:hypothetical protein